MTDPRAPRSGLDVLMDGPPQMQPRPVLPADVPDLKGARVAVFDPDQSAWVRNLRAAGGALWYDPHTMQRWRYATDPPDGADQARAELRVLVCTEQGWYEWMVTKRRPAVREYGLERVWLEDTSN